MNESRNLTCEECVSRVYEFLDGELDAQWTERMTAHLAKCKACYPYFDFERIFLDHIRGRGLSERATESLERRIKRALAEAAGDPPA